MVMLRGMTLCHRSCIVVLVAAAMCAGSYGCSGCKGRAATVDDLTRAVERGDVVGAIACVKRGIDVNACDSDGMTALTIAAVQGNVEMVKGLIKEGARVNAPNKLGYTALHQAIMGGHARVVEVLIMKGADVSIKTKSGFTAYSLAKQLGLPEEVVKKLSDPEIGDSHQLK